MLWQSIMLISLLTTAGLAAAMVSPIPRPSPQHKRRATEIPENFDWNTIEPSRDLEYTPCYDEQFKCARLLVPLDWSKHNSTCGGGGGGGLGNGSDYSVAIAIATLPAVVPDTDPSFGGTVLYNPGGPGGAVIHDPPLYGQSTQFLVDGEKHFEIMLFDPRGVGHSTPAGQCFEHAWQEQLYRFQKQTAGHIGAGPETFAVHFEYERAHGELCSQQGQHHINAHMGTASVARDMLHLVEKADEERRRRNGEGPRGPDEGKPRLQYVGHSYGSVLGNYFASMFPGRVGRMMVVGVADADAYRAGKWNTSMLDTEDAIDDTYEACFNRSCPLRLDSDTSPLDIRARVDAAISDLDAGSASVVLDGQVHVVRSEPLRQAVLSWAYMPMDPGDYFAEDVLAIVSGNYSTAVTPITPEDFSSSDAGRVVVPMTEVGAVIRCLDLQTLQRPLNISWAHEIYTSMEELSPTAAPAWAILALRCAGFTLRPAFDFGGAFGSPAPDASDPGAPAAPLLLVSSRADPVTPLADAWAMSRQHPHSSVVIAQLTGHNPFWPSSACLLDAARAYFAHGVVPANGTVCVPDPVSANDTGSLMAMPSGGAVA